MNMIIYMARNIELTLQNCNKDSGSVTSKMSRIKSADKRERCILIRSSESVCPGKSKKDVLYIFPCRSELAILLDTQKKQIRGV